MEKTLNKALESAGKFISEVVNDYPNITSMSQSEWHTFWWKFIILMAIPPLLTLLFGAIRLYFISEPMMYVSCAGFALCAITLIIRYGIENYRSLVGIGLVVFGVLITRDYMNKTNPKPAPQPQQQGGRKK